MKVYCAMMFTIVTMFTLYATPVVTQNGALQRSGAKITGSKTGTPVQVAGMSLFWSIWGGENFYTSDVIASLATNWNATLVRASIAVENGGYLTNPDTQLAYAKTIVDAAIASDIYVLVDWHDHNANLHVNEAKDFFSKMAQMYADTPNVIWEIWNEPDDKNGTGFDGGDSWNDIKTYADTIISVIRKYSSNLVVVGTPMWSSDPESAAEDPVADSNVAYACHFYAGSHGALNRTIAEAAMRKGAAIFITECGSTDSKGGSVNRTVYTEETNTWLDWADNKKISWAGWSISRKDEASSALLPTAPANGVWPDSLLSISGKFFRNRLLARSESQINDSASIFATIQGKGSVTTSPGKMVKKGTSVTITAAAENGWTFIGWVDGLTSTANPLVISVDDNISLTAQFAPDPGIDLIKNGDFSEGKEGWYSWVKNTCKATITFADSQVKFSITKADTLDWTIQISQDSNVTLDSGVEYTVSLDAWSTANRPLCIWMVEDKEPASDVGGDTIYLTPSRKNYTVKITPPFTTTRAKFQILASRDTFPVFVDNVHMYRSTCSQIFRRH
ncbi:MAG TPA: cellulase family glycosylhydrolase, partial [Chitinispirillaceae bacterium]|nr:cellulase family glycosylhydrolase [Chitinispirillaceae bacterium]